MASPSGIALELEHSVGFGGGARDCIRWQADGNGLLWPAGAVVVQSDPSDPHGQRFLRGHSDVVTALDISRSGKFLATGQAGTDSDAAVWDLGSSELLFRLEEHDHGIADVAFSADERVLATVGVPADGTLILWDLATGCIITRTPISPATVACAAFGGMTKDVKRRPTGLYQLATAGSGGVTLWAVDPLTGSTYSTAIKMPSGLAGRDCVCLDFSPSELLLAAGTTAGELLLVDSVKRGTGACVRVRGGGVGAVRFLCETLLACGTREGEVLVMDLVAPGEPVPVLRQRVSIGGVTSLAWSPARGSLAAGCDDGRLVELRLPDLLQRRVEAESGVTASVSSAAASPAASPAAAAVVASAVPSSAESECVVLQDGHGPAGKRFGEGVAARGSAGSAASGSVSPGLLSALPGAVTCVSYARGVSDAFVTGGDDGTVRLWSAADYSVAGAAKERDAGSPVCCAQSLDLLVVGWQDGTVRGYSGETVEHLFTVPRAHSGDKGGTTAVQVAGNERFMLTGGGEGSVRVWELRSREMICDLRGHAGRITDAALFRDDVHAMTVSRDRTMVCWDLRKERRVSSHTQRLGAITTVTLSHDQSVVLTGGQAKAITLWDLREPQPVQSIKDAHSGSEVTCLACLSQQDAIVSAGADGSVRLWDVRTGKRLSQGEGHTSSVHSLAVASDGKQVVSVGGDGCVLVWNVFAEAAVEGDT